MWAKTENNMRKKTNYAWNFQKNLVTWRKKCEVIFTFTCDAQVMRSIFDSLFSQRLSDPSFFGKKMSNPSCSCKKVWFSCLFRHVTSWIVVFWTVFACIFFHVVPRYTGGDPDTFLAHVFRTRSDKRILYLQKKCVLRIFCTLFATRCYGDCRFLLFFCSSFAHILPAACLGDVDILACNFFHLVPRYTGGDPDTFLTHFFRTKSDKRILYLQKKCVLRIFAHFLRHVVTGIVVFLLVFFTSLSGLVRAVMY